MSKRIMVVDDDAAILILADVILRRQRFDVTKVQNAFKALSLLGSMSPDLFVIDMMMPGMSGLELCQHIRLLPETANTPVIMVSAQTDPSVMRKGLEAGADDCLAKTSLHHELVNRVRRLLGAEAAAAGSA